MVLTIYVPKRSFENFQLVYDSCITQIVSRVEIIYYYKSFNQNFMILAIGEAVQIVDFLYG